MSEEINKIEFLKEELEHTRDNVNKLNGKQAMEKLETLETIVLKNVTSMYNSNKEFVDDYSKILEVSEDRKILNNFRESLGLFDEEMIDSLIAKERARQAEIKLDMKETFKIILLFLY